LSRLRRIILFCSFVIIGVLVFYLYSYLGTKYWNFQFPQNSFLFPKECSYSDYFSVNSMVAGLNPYSLGSSYPPFALIVAYFFAKLCPTFPTPDGIMQSAIHDSGIFCLKCIYLISLLVIVYLVWKKGWSILMKHPISHDDIPESKIVRMKKSIPVILALFLLSIVIFINAPIAFAFDRGNYLVICVLFIGIFCLFYNQNDYLSATFLGFAAAMKIFPLVIFFVFIRDRKWKSLALGFFVTIAVSYVSLSHFLGDMHQNVKAFLTNLLSFTNGLPPAQYSYYWYAINIRAFIGNVFIATIGHIPAKFDIVAVSQMFAYSLAVLVIILCLLDKRAWRRILYLSFLMILFPVTSYYYNLAYLIGPIILFLFKEDMEKLDWVYLFGLALLMIPKNYMYFLYDKQYGYFSVLMGLDYLINPMIMCLLICVSAADVFHTFFSNRLHHTRLKSARQI